jgi:DNA-binding transcriptional ArsR family regulator
MDLKTAISNSHIPIAWSARASVSWRLDGRHRRRQDRQSLSHPLRIALVRTLRECPELSPVEYARESSERLANVSYHMTVLREAGVIAVAETVARRGAVEHRYALTGRRAKAALALLDLLADA